MNDKHMILVDAGVLPEVYSKVLEAKRLLQSGEIKLTADACTAVGISRSAFYKYRDFVFEYNESGGSIITLYALLSDVAGILSKFMSVLYESGANILTVNQNIPTGGRANVSVSFRTEHLKSSSSELIAQLKALDGVHFVDVISA